MNKIVQTLALACMTFLATGCASFAANPEACKNAPPLLPLPYSFIGNVFQIGPCASIEALRVETGAEANYVSGAVFRAIDTNKTNTWVELFARRMGCNADVYSPFFEKLVANKAAVFGEDAMASDREVVSRTRKLLKEDPVLMQGCGLK